MTEKGVSVIGVSSDTVKAQKKFVTANKLPYLLLADTEQKVIKAFGVPSVKVGKPFAQRQAYLFKSGKLVWRDLKASTDKQAKDVLAAMENLATE